MKIALYLLLSHPNVDISHRYRNCVIIALPSVDDIQYYGKDPVGNEINE